jgi:hypothetical protein
LSKSGKDESKVFKDANHTAILGEFTAFGKAVLEGKKDPNGDHEKALADLTVMEFMLKSGENGGQPVSFKY